MNESGENYLETILILEEKMGMVRSIDIARELNFSKPSVSRAMGLLKNKGFIKVSEEGYIKLTDDGRKKAEDIYDRHKTLTTFIMKIAGVSRVTAENDACHIEHVISRETYEGIKRYTESL